MVGRWSSVERDILMQGPDLAVDDFRLLDMRKRRSKTKKSKIKCRRRTPIDVDDKVEGEDQDELT